MELTNFSNISFKDFKWLNEPKKWSLNGNILEVTTDEKTDFWQGTWYDFHVNTGHFYGINVKDDFNVVLCVEADYTTLYDQAGLMVYIDETHWLKTGIEFVDGTPLMSSVLTDQNSDWATGIFNGDPRKFYLRLTKAAGVLCIRYSTDKERWTLLRLCKVPKTGLTEPKPILVGPMCCSPKRSGLQVKFSEIAFSAPDLPSDMQHVVLHFYTPPSL